MPDSGTPAAQNLKIVELPSVAVSSSPNVTVATMPTVVTQDGGPANAATQLHAASADCSVTPLVITAVSATAKRRRIDELLVSCASGLILTLRTTTAGTVVAILNIAANAPQILSFPYGLIGPETAHSIEILASGAGAVNVVTWSRDV